MNESKLLFGTGGVPWTSKKRDTLSGIKKIHELDLDHMELEFVQGVRMGKEKAVEISNFISELNQSRNSVGKKSIEITIHGPYYVNLISDLDKTIYSSKDHILNSLRIGNYLGAKSVTFHSGFIQKNSREESHKRVLIHMKEIKSIMEQEEIDVLVSPELTGKESQYGNLEELVRLCKEVPGIKFCYDFAHAYARTVGKNNTEKELREAIEYIISNLGQEFVSRMQIHMSNIVYSDKGERWHLPYLESVDDYGKYLENEFFEKEKLTQILSEFYAGGKKVFTDKFDWRMILRILKEYNVGGWLVCESPILEWDAKVMKKYYNEI